MKNVWSWGCPISKVAAEPCTHDVGYCSVATLEFHSSMFVVAVPSLVPRPSLLGSSFWSLAVCKNEARRPGESYHVICDMADVTDSRHEGIFISSYREAGQTRQVPAERQVLPLEHNQLWSILQAINNWSRGRSGNEASCTGTSMK